MGNRCSAKRDQEGLVVTGPRNFTTKGVKKGQTDDVLFGKPSYISQGMQWNYAELSFL